MSDRVLVDDAPLRLDDVVAIARGAKVAIGPRAAARIAASRAVVDGLASGPDLVYGLNTGLGHNRNERLSPEAIGTGQAVTVRLHDGGIGPPLGTSIVRAAMAVRIAGIARGGSGASPAIAETYVAMLNGGIHPVVPTVGSIGASDLMHMAAIARAAMGEGEVDVGGRRLAAGDALASAGIEPVRPGPKDGLTLISANGVAIGHAALVVDRARRLADAADLVAAISLETARGNPSVVEPSVAAAKPIEGQRVAAARIRRYLEGSRLAIAGGGGSVQDPLSFRVAPQVHGAFREVVAFAARAVDDELAAMDDNPLVVVDEGRMVSNGNFHAMLLALAVDALRPAVAHLGQISDRRAGQLWDRMASDSGGFSEETWLLLVRHGSPLLRYAGAARVAELRTLAGPATLDVPALDLGVEDHATNAPLAARRSEEALALAEDVLAVELLTATATLGASAETRAEMAPRTGAAFDAVGRALAGMGPAHSAARVHGAAVELLRGGLVEAADGARA
jgi:histidine ammonia-lyase